MGSASAFKKRAQGEWTDLACGIPVADGNLGQRRKKLRCKLKVLPEQRLGDEVVDADVPRLIVQLSVDQVEVAGVRVALIVGGVGLAEKIVKRSAAERILGVCERTHLGLRQPLLGDEQSLRDKSLFRRVRANVAEKHLLDGLLATVRKEGGGQLQLLPCEDAGGATYESGSSR